MKPKKEAYCTMRADWSPCCTNARVSALGISNPHYGCDCSNHPGSYAAYKLVALPKPKKKKS